MSKMINRYRLRRVDGLLSAIHQALTEPLVETRCTQCGPVVSHDDARFCGRCGGQLAGPVDPPDEDEIDKVSRERDEARRMWAELCSSEFGEGQGPIGARIEAGKQWGRQIAAELYPDEAIRAHVVSVAIEPDDVDDDLALALARIDRSVPR